MGSKNVVVKFITRAPCYKYRRAFNTPEGIIVYQVVVAVRPHTDAAVHRIIIIGIVVLADIITDNITRIIYPGVTILPY